jgi:UDP-N-acetylglucosamine 2-epimerase (non-hydrolysing)
LTGNTGIDALLLARRLVEAEGRRPPAELRPGERLVLVTAHRRESFGPPLERVFNTLVALTRQRPDVRLLIPLHPNPNVRSAAQVLRNQERIHLCEPLEYPDFVTAMLAADVIVTDSGGVQEEAPALGKGVLVIRETTERPEGVTAGAAELVGTDPQRLLERTLAHLDAPRSRRPIHVYGDGRASQRIVEVLRWGRLAEPFRTAA